MCDRRAITFRRIGCGLVVAAFGLLSLLAVAAPASAHGGDPSQEGYLLVQQALGHLEHDTSQDGIDSAMAKVDDALAADDQDGVSVPDVEQAKAALEAGHVEQARALLQSSITLALSELGPATGEETGTTLVEPALPGRQGLTGLDGALLTVSVIFVFAGIWLAVRYRPRESVADLRRQLGPSKTPAAHRADNVTTEQRGL